MRPTFLFSVLSIALIITNIQIGSAQDKISGSSGGFHIGYKFYNTQNYSLFLRDDVADLNNNLISVGGGGYAIYKNFLLGGRGFYQGGESRDVTIALYPIGSSIDYTYSLHGGGGYLNFGYVAYSDKELLLFPQLGVGFEALVLEHSVAETVSFDPRQGLSAEYRWTSPMLDIGAGIDWFPFEKNGTKVGLRLGYTISLQRNSDWSHTGGDFENASVPDNNLDGFYLSIALGGGGFSTQK